MQETVRALARDNLLPPKPLFMPLIFAAAAKVVGLSPHQFYANPTKIANGLRQLQGPLRCDALVCYADQTLIAEALGARVTWEAGLPQVTAPPAQLLPVDVTGQGRVPIMQEVIHRLRIVLRDRVALAVVLPGVLTTVEYLSDPSIMTGGPSPADYVAAAGGATLQTARLACEAGADLILMIEDELPPAGTPVRSQWLTILETICNVTRFHESLPVLLAQGAGTDTWAQIAAQGATPCFPAVDLAQSLQAKALPDISYGLALPATVETVPLCIEKARQLQNRNCALVTTAGDLPYDIHPKELRPAVASLRDAVAAR